MTGNISEVKRGEIWWADLGAANGSVQGGVRPVVIVQNDKGNKFSPTVIVAPITKKTKNPLPVHATATKLECGLSHDSTILLEQIRVLDKSHLKGKVGEIDMDAVNHAIIVSLGIIVMESVGCNNV